MDPNVQTWLWVGAGAALVATEFVGPHLVAGFLGLGALSVAALRWFGVVESVPASFATWAVLSGAYVVALRGLLRRSFGSGEKARRPVHENARAHGTVVEVVEAVREHEPTGRIRFEGTSWPALSLGGEIPAGAKARLVHRDGLAWVVEPLSGAETALTRTNERSRS